MERGNTFSKFKSVFYRHETVEDFIFNERTGEGYELHTVKLFGVVIREYFKPVKK